VLGWLALASGSYLACNDDPRNQLLGDPGPTTHRDAADPDGTLLLPDGEEPDTTTFADVEGIDVTTLDSPADTVATDVRPDVRDATIDTRDAGPDVRDSGPDVGDSALDADG